MDSYAVENEKTFEKSMKEKIKKILIPKQIITIFIIVFGFIAIGADAVNPPSCIISISPEIIKQGENANWYLKVTGPVDKVVYKVEGILKYMGDSVYDISSLPPDSLQYQDREGFETGPTAIRPMSIGTGSETIYVYGPGGSNSCSASIEVISKDVDDKKGQEFIGTLAIPGALRDCPSLDCNIIRYYAETAEVKIVGIDENNKWYQVIAHDNYGNELTGWMHYSLFTQDYRNNFLEAYPLSDEGKEEVQEKEEIQEKGITPLSFLKNKSFQAGSIFIFVSTALLLGIFLMRKRVKAIFQPKEKAVDLRKKKVIANYYGILVALLVVIGLVGITYGAIDYQKTSELLKAAGQFTKEEKYNEAIEKLELAQNKWFTQTLGVKKQEIIGEIEKNRKLLEDKSEYTQGLEEFNKENWEKAKESLSKVSEISPYYKDAQDKIEDAQNSIVKKQITEAVEKTTKETKRITEEAQRQTAELEQKIIELQQKQQPSDEPFVSSALPSSDINKIISSVVEVVCRADSYAVFINKGSGSIWQFSDISGHFVFTNAHVVSTIDRSNPFCLVSFPQLPSGTPYYIYKTEFYSMGYKDRVDWALLKLTTPYEFQYALTQIPLLSDYPMCKFSDVNIGDKVTIFGYPTVGGNNITVTEGNISGFSGNDYKVSSGIIDKGNSGGAAILNKYKCSLGIPTWFSVGEASSVGIIQSWRTVYGDLSK